MLEMVSMLRHEVRGAMQRDEDELLALASFLNSVNLPHDRAHVRALLAHSEKSFRGELPTAHRKFVFLLRDLETQQAVGTSMIVAQLGRRDAPYIYLDVISEEKYSHAVDKHFHHTVLKIGFSYDGPTEIGGLVVAPEHRRANERLGLLISYVRFLYIAAHRELFQNEILAELLPPLEPDGTSHLWEALGRHFTDMSYAEADRLSSTDKTFIRDLFPSGDIYASLLSKDAQSVIGKVGAQTRGVEKMLRRVGFRYAERIDPFDGGPHFVAPVEEISLVQETRERRLHAVRAPSSASPRALVARDLEEAPFFRAVACPVELGADDAVIVEESVVNHLALKPGERVYVLPLR
ncbi:MAG TPA: arginine N-succinyltransferase [Polyangiaceae bacterium]|nr:arginine N-succinyltransferase [Polyangiaceae bacterium]